MTNLYSIGDLVRWRSGGKEAPVSEVISLKTCYCYKLKGVNRPISECELTLVRRAA
jgi:uncharacterized protein YodC (DUF2158 family)